MTLDQRARTSANRVLETVDDIAVPEPSAVVRRTRRRRSAGLVAVALVAAILIAAVAVRDTSSSHVTVSAPAPAQWRAVDKVAAGLPAGSVLHVLSSDGSALLLGGDRPAAGKYVVTAWRSDDGLQWTETEHPVEHNSVSAIASHDGTSLAIGAPGGTTAFVWRSRDGGRHWDEIANGPIFGASVPNNRPGAFVTGLLWHAGWWVAYGGAATGYEGIWVSRDGAQWQTALDSGTAGAIETIAPTNDGSLAAYGGRDEWFTTDPTTWPLLAAPKLDDMFNITDVAPGAAVAVAQTEVGQEGYSGRVMRSSDNGRAWSTDTAFAHDFPQAHPQRVIVVDGTEVVVGESTPAQRPDAWVSTRGTWDAMPSQLTQPSPTDALTLVAPVGNRVVMMGFAASLDRYFIVEISRPRA